MFYGLMPKSGIMVGRLAGEESYQSYKDIIMFTYIFVLIKLLCVWGAGVSNCATFIVVFFVFSTVSFDKIP